MNALSKFLGEKLIKNNIEKDTKIFRKHMNLYKGGVQWEQVHNVRVTGEMYNHRRTYTFDYADSEDLYIMFRDKFNGEYLVQV